MGVLTETGKILVTPKYDEVGDFHEGMCRVWILEKGHGFILSTQAELWLFHVSTNKCMISVPLKVCQISTRLFMIFGVMLFILTKTANMSARKKLPEIVMIVKGATLGIKCLNCGQSWMKQNRFNNGYNYKTFEET